MKRIFFSLLLAALLVLSTAALATQDAMPPEVTAHIEQHFGGYEIFDYLEIRDTPKGCYGVTLLSKEEEKLLACYREESGRMVYWLKTASAIPQGEGISEEEWKSRGQQYDGHVFRLFRQSAHGVKNLSKQKIIEYGDELGFGVILHEGSGDDSIRVIQSVAFHWEGGSFQLSEYQNNNDYYGHVFVSENKLDFYRGEWEYDATVRGVIQRELPYVSMRTLPRTPKEARNKLTFAPEIPASAELRAQDIQFAGGKKYAVYTAPGQDALRGGNGKAMVSTNGWIQVFGIEDGWALIQYSIDAGHYRFGYIPASALPKKASVPELGFLQTAAYTTGAVSVTDDPLYALAELAALPAGSPVTLLATMGEWAYIESRESGWFRGFVPMNSLSIAEDGFDTFMAEDGTAYPLFVLTKLHYGADHRVTAVTGHFERIAQGEDCYEPEMASGSERTYVLGPDFHASMITSMSGELDDFSEVTDLYAWYIGAYLSGESPDGRELVFSCDLSEQERETVSPDFWFVTTRIRLNDQGQIEYMQYEYVPWA